MTIEMLLSPRLESTSKLSIFAYESLSLSFEVIIVRILPSSQIDLESQPGPGTPGDTHSASRRQVDNVIMLTSDNPLAHSFI